MLLSVIIPAYNESQRLPATLKKVEAYLRQHHPDAEILVVDDGSSDDTAEVARRSSWPIRLIVQPHNQGKGAAVRTGMLAARGEWRLLCDADLSTPIEELEKLLVYTNQADIIIGSRRLKGSHIARSQAWWKVLLGRGGNLLIQLLAAPGIHDSQCGFKLFNQKAISLFENQRLERFGYDFELLFLARLAKLRVQEVAVLWYNDERSTVKGRDYLVTLFDLAKIHWFRWRGAYKLP